MADTTIRNLLFYLLLWAQFFGATCTFLGFGWACMTMVPFTVLGWVMFAGADKMDAPTEITGPESIQVVDGSPENN